MSVTVGWVLLNLAYLIYTASGLFKDMLRLRVVWMFSTFFFIAHGVVDQLWPAVWWNVPVFLIHVWMISQLLSQRRGIDLDDEADAIRTLIFPELERSLFNIMWHAGEERVVTDEVLITVHKPVEELSLILDGELDVLVEDGARIRMGHFRIIGEVSSLRNSMATATVTTIGTVRLRAWNKEALAVVGKKHPEIQVAMLTAMGQEVARKLN